MPQITDRKPTSTMIPVPPSSNHHHHLLKDHSKENKGGKMAMTSKTNSSSGGPAILDFRDSWLQEVELYKDQARAQQLLTTHNHLHTLDGCQRDNHPHNGYSNNGNTNNSSNGGGNETIKKRVRTRSGSDSNNKQDHNNRLHNNNHHHRDDNEVHLKRMKEDNNALNIPHHTPPPVTLPSSAPTNATTILNKIQMQVNGASNPTTTATNGNSAQTNNNKGGYKIVVNNYHAHSILSNQESNNIATCLINTPPLDGNSKMYQQIGDAPNPMPASKHKHVDNFVSVNTDKPKPKADTATIKDAGSYENLASSEESSTPTETSPNASPPKVIVIQSQKCEVTGEDDIGSNLDDDDDEDLGDIDNLGIFDDTSDSEDEYEGFYFKLPSDESNRMDFNIDTYSRPSSVLTPSLFPLVPPYISFSNHVDKGPTMPPELQKVLKWKLSPVMPKIVKKVVLNSGFRLIKKTTDWMAVWEKHMKSPGFKTIRSHQKFNHIPGSFKIGRKDSVWRNLRGYTQQYGKNEFGFMKKTFILPQEMDALKKAWPRYAKKATKWIVKPPASARGHGISVITKWSEVPKQKPLIIQKYIERPLLINNSKFDLRLYVIITSINPLRIYMHKDGLARFASVPYSNKVQTLSDRCMHLTNYSINKFSSNYAKNENVNACEGHKWTLRSLWSHFKERGIDTKKIWGTFRNLVIKTVIGGEGCLNRLFRQNVNSKYNCYELFGFDIILDENLVPWLLEVNISPSLHSDLPLDMHVKGPLIQAVLNTALYQVPPKLSETQQTNILKYFTLPAPLCYDKRLYTVCLTPDEIKKHNKYTSRQIEYREEYLDTILDDLTPDDVRCLINNEDELARSNPLERIFPNSESHIYLNFLEGSRYYNRLIDAWESKYATNRMEGIKLLRKFCAQGYHLRVPAAAMAEEPHIEFTDVDLLHTTMIRPNSVILNGDIKTMTGPPLISQQMVSKNGVQLSCSKEVNDEDFVTRSTLPVEIKVSGGV
ncbi:TTLL4 family protein [Megaselia abdita]